jgi:hypothetical protein
MKQHHPLPLWKRSEMCWDKEKKDTRIGNYHSKNYEPSKYHKELYKKSNIDTHRYEKDGTARKVLTDGFETYEDVDMHCLRHTEDITSAKMLVNREKIMLSIDKLKPNETKLHQISGYREWKELSRGYLSNIQWISYSLVKDKTQTKNAVTGIMGGYEYDDYYHYDWVKYKHTKVPVMYIEIKKHDYATQKKRMKNIKEELLAYIYHPDRINEMNNFDYLRA